MDKHKDGYNNETNDVSGENNGTNNYPILEDKILDGWLLKDRALSPSFLVATNQKEQK